MKNNHNEGNEPKVESQGKENNILNKTQESGHVNKNIDAAKSDKKTEIGDLNKKVETPAPHDSHPIRDYNETQEKKAHDKGIETFTTSGNWVEQSKQLKAKYPQLTDADLKFEAGKESEILSRVETRLGKKRAEVIELINKCCATAETFKVTGNWVEQSKQLKAKFPQLTDADLKFEAGKESEMLSRVETCLGKKRAEVIELIKNSHKN
jgi:hypothetical protein